MRRTLLLGMGIVLGGVMATAPLQGQEQVELRGQGQRATEMFALDEGLVVFELDHAGTGRFRVRLLDERGEQVEELVDAQGAFRGSKAVRIGRTGRYLMDVNADGSWTVRRRDPAGGSQPAGGNGSAILASPEGVRGLEAGTAAAAGVGSGSWFLRGLVGGVLGGPIGTGIAMGVAGRSGVTVPEPAGSPDPLFRQGFSEAYIGSVRKERRRKAFVGGMVGSAVFVGTALLLFDLNQGGSAGPILEQPPTGELSILPAR